VSDESPPKLSDIDTSPDNLPAIIAPADVPVAELKVRFDQVAEENFGLKADNAALKGRLATKEAIDGMLRPYSEKVYRFLCGYGIGSFGLVLLDGFHYRGFDLPEVVAVTIVGSTAVSAIGLVGLVIRGMFKAANPN
jgi:regulator of replication initiation timing